jgi:hypothetical protein
MSEATNTLPRKNKEINPSAKDIERFWSKVDIKGPDDCWEWKEFKAGGGYGRFWLNNEGVVASRVAWVIANGPIDDGLFVCHHCDNPGCCNPSHLFVGTYLDNVADRVAKGRCGKQCGKDHWVYRHPECIQRGENHWTKRMPEISCRGEKSNWAVLTAKSVKEIREIRKSGMSYAKIAKMFNVHRGTVGHIIRGSTWAHLE